MRSWFVVVAAASWLLVAAMCAGPNPKPDGADAGAGGAAGTTGGAGPSAPIMDWDCQQAIPPTGWLQETRYVSADQPNALDHAKQTAEKALVAKVCGKSGCPSLMKEFSIWKAGSGNGYVCAMAVVKAAKVERWRRSKFSIKDLDKKLQAAATELLGSDAARKKPPFIFIWRIVDSGVPGGDRARWLMPRLRRALQKAGGVLVQRPPKDWDGRKVPKGVQLVVTATLTPREEDQIPVLELLPEATFTTRGATAMRSADPIVFPAAAAPHVDEVLPTPPAPDPDVGIRVDAASGGGLCAGDKTQVWVSTSTDLHVRVFDLYGKDGAFLLFPNPDQPDGLIKGGRPFAIGGDAGFEAMPAAESDAERFLVIAGRKKVDLGPFAYLHGYCRMPTETAKRLHRFEGIPRTAKVSSDGFRIFTGGHCKALSAGARAEVSRRLAEFAECK